MGDVYAESGVATDQQLAAAVGRFVQGDRVGACTELRGSFVLIVLQPDAFAVVTDRVASRKLFRWETPEGTWLDTDLSAFRDRAVDPAGVASLIMNRFVYGGRTIFSDVVSLPRANIHRCDGRRWHSDEYWQYDFSSGALVSPSADPVALRAELWRLIRRAITRRIPAEGPLLLSLSGGVDSRVLLAGLTEQGFPATRLKTFSYGSVEDDDAAVASELASSAALPWTLVPGSEALPRLLRENAAHGEGQVFFYPRGLDGFADLVRSLGPAVTVMVGDECYGWNDMPLGSADEVLSRGIGIRSPANVPSYYSYGAFDHRAIAQTLQEDVDALKRRYEHIESWHDLKDVLYLDQRLSNMLLPWRERHAGRFGRLVNPHIDDDILEFMKGVPTELRMNKRLFRETALQFTGDFSQVRYARTGGCSNDFLDQLFIRHQDEVEHLALGNPSALDEVLPPEVIGDGLTQMCLHIEFTRSRLPAPLAGLIRKLKAGTTRYRFSRGRRSREDTANAAQGAMSLAPIQMATVLQLRMFLAGNGSV